MQWNYRGQTDSQPVHFMLLGTRLRSIVISCYRCVQNPPEPWRPVGRHTFHFTVSQGEFVLFYLSRLAVLNFWEGT